MRRRNLILATASLYASCAGAFSIHDDFLAFPQYEIVFSDKYIPQAEAESRLAHAASPSHAQTAVAEPSVSDAPSSDLSTRDQENSGTGASNSEGDNLGETYEQMVLDDLAYLCAIPLPHAAKNKTEPAEPVEAEDEAKELARATDRGWQLLQELSGQCLYYQSGWWSYSFCYQNEVKQFHAQAPPRGQTPPYPPVEDQKVPSFYLGEFRNDGRPAPPPKQVDDGSSQADAKPRQISTTLAVQTKGDVRYLAQNLTGGTTCDLTGRPRRVEVQFHCHQQSADRIGWIKEVATCAYLMVIYTPRLCNDVAFLPPKEHEAEQIVCREVVAPDGLEGWKSRQAADAERRLLLSNAAGSTAGTGAHSRPVIGGIEVGGYNVVPHEGQRISPPQLVEQIPNKGEVIAQWDPKADGGEVRQLSDSDLRKLDLDPRTVEQMKEQIHEEAGGRPWKLEIVEIAGGMRELIGIVEKGDQEWFDDDPPEDEGSEEQFKEEL